MNIIKKLTALALTAFLSLALCSCDSVYSNDDALIIPPTLFEEQEDIMRALRRSAGDKITLEYPRTGENRSAFLLSDIDGDSENEAIAFYRPASDNLNQDIIHINVLDSDEQNGWISTCDIVGEASGIDRVSIGEFSGQTEIIIGWELIKDREKTLVCYSLSGKNLVRDYTATYVEFAVADFWQENEGGELITLNYSETTENLTQPTQHARLIVKDLQGFAVKSSTPLDSRVTGYKSCIAGKYNQTHIGYFLDGTIDAATVNTQILTVSSRGQIQNPLLSKENRTADDNVHRPSLLTQDMDGDLIYEVPHQQAVTGYDNVPESERIYKTVWKQLESGRLKKSAVMYINTALGIRVAIPERLDGNVTLRPIMAQNELVFYEYEGSLEKSTHQLFSIRVSEKDFYEWENGYEILCSNEYTVVTVKLHDPENELCPTWENLFDIVDIM